MNLKTTPFPFKVNKFPFFYGWVILLAGTVGVIMSIPGQTMGVSVFTDYLIDALKIERTSLSLAYLIGTVLSGFLITKAGKYYDKHGARVMAMVAGFMLGLIVIGLTKIDVLINGFFPNNESNSQAAAFVLLIIGFFGIRFFGQGILTMVSRNMVMKWFDKKRGLANALMGVFVSFGFSYAPRLFNIMIENNGWRNTWISIGLIVGIGFVVFALIFYRDNAEDCGLKPDGKIVKHKGEQNQKTNKAFTLKQAKLYYSFWVFNLAIALNALYVTALTFHIVSIFQEVGLDRSMAISIFLPASFVAVALNFIGGWISDYIKLKYLLMINMLGMTVSSLGIMMLGEINVAFYLIIIGNGIVSGIFSVINSVTWPRFFGTKHLGAISGYAMSYTVIASALGPYLFSLSLKYFNGYWAGAGVCVVLSVLIFVLAFKANNIEE